MNPDVAQALPTLVESGIVPAAAAPRLQRMAAGQLVSLHSTLRAFLYLGVLAFTTGIGMLLAQNLDRLGPMAIALGLAVVALAALAWMWRMAPPFSWQEVPAPNLAFDYVLLLAILVGAADLGYCDQVFPSWAGQEPHHLLLVSALSALAAVRFDSRLALSCALTSFAGWRGVSLARATTAVWSAQGDLRWNALGCGVFFVLLGLGFSRSGRKPHFEPVCAHLGWLLVLGALGSGLADRGWALALFLVGAALAAGSFFARRFPLFAYGVVAAYIALLRLVGQEVQSFQLGCVLVGGSAVGVILFLLMAYRRLKGGEE
jgi:hypothetical protein